MKRQFPLLGFLVSWLLLFFSVSAAERKVESFDGNWRFLKADSPGAENPAFDDSSWRSLNVPHDWSIEGPFDEKNTTGGAGGFLPGGVGWYRKHFVLPTADAGQHVFVEFDGVMANSDVWINGTLLGHRPYGYVAFRYELTGHVTFGPDHPNVIAVRADNESQPASRWYTGAGIYRHVKLIVTDPVHFEKWSTFVSTPSVSEREALVHVETIVRNDSSQSREVSVKVSLASPNGKTVVKKVVLEKITVAPGASQKVSGDVKISKPDRWDIDHPVLYQATVVADSSFKTFDSDTVPFGIREFHFDPDTGFWLNGKNFKLKGVCFHHEGGAFGAAVPLGVWEHRLNVLRSLGVNAIRPAHNPFSSDFLDLCDRMGFLVMDEMFDCWTVAKNPYDYHLYFNEWSKIDTRDIVQRDRNHPSIILYSAGNEIHDTPKADLAKEILKGLVDVFHENDPTRPVTQALFRPNVSHDYDNGLADLLDVVGQNYRENEIIAAHVQKPSRKIVGTENGHDRKIWLALRDNAPYAGQFLWTGIDYLGESSRWPVVVGNSGLIDKIGTPRPLAYERQSWWTSKPMIYIARRIAPSAVLASDPGYEKGQQVEATRKPQVLFHDWTPRELKSHDENVEIYSNCTEVELFLDGKSLGAKTLPTDASARNWTVKFSPGILRAVGKMGGKIVCSDELRTAGAPKKVLLKVEQERIGTGWDDVAFVHAVVVDQNGTLVPSANQTIGFSVQDGGTVAAVDSGSTVSHEPFQATQREAFQGECYAMIKATGLSGKPTKNIKPLVVTATAAGLVNGSVEIPLK